MSAAAIMVSKYIEAELALLAGKTITFQGRSMSMENLQEIRAGRREWEERLAQDSRAATCRLSVGGMSFSVASFGDRK